MERLQQIAGRLKATNSDEARALRTEAVAIIVERIRAAQDAIQDLAGLSDEASAVSMIIESCAGSRRCGYVASGLVRSLEQSLDALYWQIYEAASRAGVPVPAAPIPEDRDRARREAHSYTVPMDETEAPALEACGDTTERELAHAFEPSHAATDC